MRAPTSMRMPTSTPMGMPPRMRVTPLPLLIRPITMHPRQNRRAKEHDNIHDAESEASLEHRARFRNLDADGGGDEVPEEEAPVAVAGDAGAVDAGDVPEEVDGGDEGAEESDVDEGDEGGVGGGAVVGEDGEDGPGEGEHGDDEEDEDVVGGEDVFVLEAVDEPGEHAYCGDLGN